jgi:hypothetical protein
MNWATYGVIIIFGAFVILMILNPNLSCFGRKIKSPFYPILRQRKKPPKRIKTQDYGFNLQVEGDKPTHKGQKIGEEEELFLDQFKDKKYKTKDYGFKLTDNDETQDTGSKEGGGKSSA